MKGMHGGDIYRNRVNMDFSVNINPLGMPDKVETALHRAVKQCREYPDIMAEKLTRAVGGMLRIPKEYLLFGNGASELFIGITHTLRPKKTLLPVPSFYGYEYAAEAVKSEIIYYLLREDAGFLPGEDFLEALTEEADLLFLANPNNPTGRRVDRKFLRRVLRICGDKKINVVLDECFIEFCGNGYSMLPEIGRFDNLLVVRAFTKIFAIPGVRLGYIICKNRTLLEKIRKQLPEWNLSVFAQEAGIACTGEAAYIEKTAGYVEEERRFLTDGLKKSGCKVFCSEANFLLIYSDKPLYEKLLQRGILIRDCADFKGLSKGYYRIAVKRREENEKLLKAIGECVE